MWKIVDWQYKILWAFFGLLFGRVVVWFEGRGGFVVLLVGWVFFFFFDFVRILVWGDFLFCFLSYFFNVLK